MSDAKAGADAIRCVRTSLESAQLIGAACKIAFGGACVALEAHDRFLLMVDVRTVAYAEDMTYREAALELARRIGGPKHLGSYLDCLRATEEREARKIEAEHAARSKAVPS